MSAERIVETSLAEALRRTRNRDLPRGWLFLAPGAKEPSRRCILVPHNLCDDEQGEEKLAADLGFPVSSLCTDDLEQVVDGAALLTSNPSDEQLIECFAWYCEHDSFLPAFGAPPPPPVEIILRKMDEDFCMVLGAERAGTKCRHEGCDRGTVEYSVFCRRHHFESVKQRPYPFEV